MVDIVTGGAGFIGSHLTELLLSLGRKVRVIDLAPWGYESHPNLEVTKVDIRNQLTPELFDQAENVYHLAALADIVPSIEDPVNYFHTNVTGTLNVLEAARVVGAKKIIYAASSSCYGADPLYPTKETHDVSPQYPYALTKMMGEDLVGHWETVYKIPVVSLRLFNVYGLRARTKGTYGAMFGTFLAQLANDKLLTIVGDGKQKRDFVHVKDVVRAFHLASLHTGPGNVFNIASGKPISVNDIAKLLGAKFTVNIPKRPGEPDVTYANINEAKEHLGWVPEISIEEGISELLDNLSSYKEAPLWDEKSIAKATEAWFRHLS